MQSAGWTLTAQHGMADRLAERAPSAAHPARYTASSTLHSRPTGTRHPVELSFRGPPRGPPRVGSIPDYAHMSYQAVSSLCKWVVSAEEIRLAQ